MSDTTPLWTDARLVISEHYTNEDIRASFIEWSVIQATMFVGNAPYVPEELKFIEDYAPELLPALDHKVAFGATASDLLPNTTGNSIHQLYHLAQWHLYNPLITIGQLDSILEIGGGYGEMARIVNALGFEGDYYIYDLPEVHTLQTMYLGAQDLGSEVHYLDQPDKLFDRYDLVIACFSLSEFPQGLRDALLNRIYTDHWMIVFAPTFYGIDNDRYFAGFVERKMTNFEVFTRKNADNRTDWRYLLAKRRSK